MCAVMFTSGVHRRESHLTQLTIDDSSFKIKHFYKKFVHERSLNAALKLWNILLINIITVRAATKDGQVYVHTKGNLLLTDTHRHLLLIHLLFLFYLFIFLLKWLIDQMYKTSENCKICPLHFFKVMSSNVLFYHLQ